ANIVRPLGGWQHGLATCDEREVGHFILQSEQGGRATALSMSRLEHPIGRLHQCRLPLDWIDIRYGWVTIASRYGYAALCPAGREHKFRIAPAEDDGGR